MVHLILCRANCPIQSFAYHNSSDDQATSPCPVQNHPPGCDPLINNPVCLRNLKSFLQVASNEFISASVSKCLQYGPPSKPMFSSNNARASEFRKPGLRLISRTISPPSSHKLSMCLLIVLSAYFAFIRSSMKGLNISTILSPNGMSSGNPFQRCGHWLKSGQTFSSILDIYAPRSGSTIQD